MLGGHTISASDMDYLENARCGQFECTDDVYTDTGKLRLGGESRSEIGVGRLEYMGNLPGDRCTSGMFVGDGNYIRAEGTEKIASWKGRCGRRRGWASGG